uniref:FAR1 domain-containing protein n=1 Tax=Salix viminalis TaxID=40686 RepID=A0A6N2MMH8_SALVM
MVVEPHKGMEYESEDAAKVFYGGLLRKHSMEIWKCSKAKPSTREGCKAKFDKSGKWVVTKFVKDHNHPLIVAPREARQTMFEFLVNGVMQLGVKEIGVYLNSSIPKGEIDEHKRLNDLVFVRYDLRIQQRNLSKTRDALDNIDLLNKWICEEPNLLD